MKKNPLLYVIVLMTLLFSACSKTDMLPSRSGGENQLTGSRDPNALKSAGDGQNDLLGYGYDVTGEFANSSASKFSVINIVALKAAEPTRVEWDLSSRKTGEVIAGEDAVSFSRSLTDKLGSGLSVPDPNAAPSTDPKIAKVPFVKLTINSDGSSTNFYSSKYIFSSYSLKIQQKRVKFNANLALLQQYLQPSFISDVQNETPQSIVSKYGTHVLSDIILGAKLNIMYRSETTNSDRKTAATNGIEFSIKGIFNIDGSHTVTTQEIQNNVNQRLFYETIGGEPSASLFGNVPIGGTMPAISTTAWENSSSLLNAELVDIPENGLIPLWDLITDPVKSAAVKAYISQYLIDNRVNLLPTDVYEYYSGSLDKHAYNLDPNMQLLYPSFSHNGQPFKAFSTPYFKTAQVYQFYNPTTGDHALTTNAAPGWAGYVNSGVLFYAHSTQVLGSVPVYEFFNASTKNHFYSTNRNASAPFVGWIYVGIPFYAYP